MDEADAQPLGDKFALQADNAIEERERRVGGFGQLGEMAANAVIGELDYMIGAEMRGKKLEGSDADVTARDPRQHRAGMRAFALDAVPRRDGGERPRRRDTHRGHRFRH